MANLIEALESANAFHDLLRALEAAGLSDTLRFGGPFTVFAPTEGAFAKVAVQTLHEIMHEKEVLTAILQYHVLEGTYTSKDLEGLSTATTVQGEDVELRLVDGRLKVDSGFVELADMKAANGVIHAIDAVLIPEAASVAQE